MLLGAKNPVRVYPGQYEDQETGLHYNKYRYYSPIAGRYLRTDPLFKPFLNEKFVNIYHLLLAFRPKEINPYQYAALNPLKHIDYSGLFISACKCANFSEEIGDGIEICEKEVEDCKKKRGELECAVYFIEKYTTNGDPDFAQINCVCKAIGGGNWDEGKKKCAKGFASCIKMSLKAPKSPK